MTAWVIRAGRRRSPRALRAAAPRADLVVGVGGKYNVARYERRIPSDSATLEYVASSPSSAVWR